MNRLIKTIISVMIENSLFRDRFFITGVILCIISQSVSMVALAIDDKNMVFYIFLINYIITLIYFITLIVKAIFRRKTNRFCRIFPALVLWLISAYSLNRSAKVFDSSQVWFPVTLTLISIACISLAYFQMMPYYLRCFTMAVTGVAIIVFLYLSSFLLKLCIIALIIFWIFFGIPLHSFVPVVFLIFIIKWIVKFRKDIRGTVWALLTGAVVAVIYIAAFVGKSIYVL